MKKMLRLFKFLIICVCIFVATQTKIEAKKVSLWVGDTKQLKAYDNEKVKWKIKSGKSVTLTKKGKIFAVRKGRAKVVAIKKDKKKVFKIKVKDKYFTCDLKDVAKVMITDLQYGYQITVCDTKIDEINNVLTSQSLCKVMKDDSVKKVGGAKYSLTLYDDRDNYLGQYVITNKLLEIYKADNKDRKTDEYYKSKSSIDCSYFEEMFKQ